MQNAQFHGNSQTREQALTPTLYPHPTFLFPGSISFIVELTRKINQCPLPFLMIFVFLFQHVLTKVTQKLSASMVGINTTESNTV